MTEYRISLKLDALEDQTELRKSVKRILEVIVGLLKDRMEASDEPASKKQRVLEKIKSLDIASGIEKNEQKAFELLLKSAENKNNA